MKITKKILSLATAALTLPVLALAAYNPNNIPEPSGSFSNGGFGALFTAVLSLIWPIVGGLAAIMIVVAGIIFITANGDPEKVATARTALIWAVIGIVVAILAYSIPAIISIAVHG